MRLFDLAIVGCGPAGMAAAVDARRHGLAVAVFDEQSEPGGQIYRQIETCPPDRMEILGESYRAGLPLVAAFRASGAEFFADNQVWHIDPAGTLFTRGQEGVVKYGWRKLLLATGAHERAVPLPGWTLPGVRTVGAAQILFKSGGLLPPPGSWIVGSGPLPLLFAYQLAAAGVALGGFIDTSRLSNVVSSVPHMPSAFRDFATLATGIKYQWAAATAGTPYIRGARDIRIEGCPAVEAIVFTLRGRTRRVSTQSVLLHDGILPGTRPIDLLELQTEWHPDQHYFKPVLDEYGRSSQKNVLVAGDAGGIFGALAAQSAGRLAAYAAAVDLGRAGPVDAEVAEVRTRHARLRAIRPMLDRLYVPAVLPTRLDDDLVICRCEGVTAGTVRTATATDGATGANEIKAFTRVGMGPCQGQVCGNIITRLAIAELGRAPQAIGTYRARPPLRPIRLSDLAKSDREA